MTFSYSSTHLKIHFKKFYLTAGNYPLSSSFFYMMSVGKAVSDLQIMSKFLLEISIRSVFYSSSSHLLKIHFCLIFFFHDWNAGVHQLCHYLSQLAVSLFSVLVVHVVQCIVSKKDGATQFSSCCGLYRTSTLSRLAAWRAGTTTLILLGS